MPLDGICMQAVAEELRPELLGLRIDKVQQPARDQVILLLRGNKRLLLNAGANAPRIQLTALTRDNPAEPPMFCMLLRKHLVGGRVAAVTQPPLERLVRLELDVTDDFGQPGRRTLVLEAMGRRSNLILLDGAGRVIDCLRRVDAEMSSQRLVLPGSLSNTETASYKAATPKTTPSRWSWKSSSSAKTTAKKTARSSRSKAQPVSKYRKTKFLWPVKGTVISHFGTIGKGRTNDGINIKAALGTNVKAADKGTVAYAGNELKGFGNLILIKHDDGWITAYAHNDRLFVKKGQRVARGEKIATVGSTGGVNTPQLHFEVRSGKKALNPTAYLP